MKRNFFFLNSYARHANYTHHANNTNCIHNIFILCNILIITIIGTFAVSKISAEESLKNKIAQLFIINLEGSEKFIPVEDCVPGGYLLFSYNIAHSPKEIMIFTSSIKNYYKNRNSPAPYLAIDQEGGTVNRLRGISGPLPSPKRVVECLTPAVAKELYTQQAIQMKLLGFDMNIAPVVEVLTKDNENFLLDRSYGTLNNVTTYAAIAVKSFEDNGISTIIKHFPGNTNSDPHNSKASITYTQSKLNDITAPFNSLLKSNPTGVLMSSIIAQPIDNIPACLSSKWVDLIYQNNAQLQNNLLIFSDDIFMASFQKAGFTPLSAAICAIKAGVTCIMSSEKRINSLVSQIENAAQSDNELKNAIDENYKKVINYKNSLTTPSGTLDERVKEFNKIMWDDIYLYRKYFAK